MEKRIIQVEEKVPVKLLIPLSIQHMFAMFGASVLVPFLFGISPAIVLFMNGIGTLLFIAITKGKAPAYLGSSFAFLAPASIVIQNFGYEYALGGFVAVGFCGCILALIIYKFGTDWINIVLPPAAMGPVVALIGLELSANAASNAGLLDENIDPRKITWRRCVDMNDRQLRNVVDGLGGRTNGMPREDGYDITVASEIMAVLCLASDIKDLKERLSKIIIGYTYGKVAEQKPVTAGDLHAEGAMTALLKDALKPNLVQTLEHVPAIVHGGPFANIAHGCNSVTATKMALKLADYAITEAGFGADLGAEKFLDIKCRMADLHPSAVVIVATVRALKYNGGVAKADLNNENLEALEKGIPNLLKHVSNIKNVYKLPCVVAINAFPTDTKAELDFVEAKCKELGVNVALSEVWAKGGEGGIKLAEEVLRLVEEPNDFSYAYELEGSIEDKLNQIVQKVYGGKRVVLTANAQKQAKQLEALGFGNCPICVAKTQYSLTDDQTKLGAPTDFEVTVRNLKISAGAGFIVALTGEIMTMPGLPKVPAAERIDVDETGKITGLF